MLTSTRKVKRIDSLAHIFLRQWRWVFIKDQDPGASAAALREGRTQERQNKTSFRSSYRMVNILFTAVSVFVFYLYLFNVKAASILNFYVKCKNESTKC